MHWDPLAIVAGLNGDARWPIKIGGALARYFMVLAQATVSCPGLA